MTTPITTSTGTTVDVVDDEEYGDRVIRFRKDDAPDGMREIVAGRIITIGDGSGFQSVPFPNFGMTPEVLRAIATIIENQETTA